MTKQFKAIRTYRDDHDRLVKLCTELGYIEGKPITIPQIINRWTTSDTVKMLSKNDSELRRRGSKR